MWIIVALNFLFGNYNICVISESSSDAWYLQAVFFLLAFGVSCNFLLKAGHVVLNNKNWAFSMRITWIWLEWTVIMSAVVTGARGFKFLQCPCFCLCSGIWAFLSTSHLWNESLSWSSFSYTPCYCSEPCWSGGDVWGREGILQPWLQLRYSSDLCPSQRLSTGTDFHPWDRRSGGWKWGTALPPAGIELWYRLFPWSVRLYYRDHSV